MSKTEETIATARKRLALLFAEDRFNRREHYNPTWTLDELAKLTGTPKPTLSKWVLEAGVGRTTVRNGHYCRVLSLSEIQELAKEFNWL